jgi:protease-4
MDDTNLPPGNAAPPPPPSSPIPPPLTPPRFVPPPPRPRRSRGLMIAVILLACFLAVSLLMNFANLAGGFFELPTTASRQHGPRLDEVIVEDNDSFNKVAVVSVEGIISEDMFDATGYNLVEYIRDQLDRAAEDSRVKAVLLKVNSPGGEVLASDEIYNAISNFQKESGKPVVASMAGVAASGGYYVSAPCRWIVANELTITGSIGVILHSFNYRGLMDKVGLRPVVYKSGKFKNMLSGDRREEEIPPEEKEMLQGFIDETFGKFKTVVAVGRKQSNEKNQANAKDKGQALSADWDTYADGRILSGKEAFEIGLVDELGNFEAAVQRAFKLAKVENANLVQYQQIFDLSSFFRLFGKSEPAKIKLDIGIEPPPLKAGQPYFLSPTMIH